MDQSERFGVRDNTPEMDLRVPVSPALVRRVWCVLSPARLDHLQDVLSAQTARPEGQRHPETGNVENTKLHDKRQLLNIADYAMQIYFNKEIYDSFFIY